MPVLIRMYCVLSDLTRIEQVAWLSLSPIYVLVDGAPVSTASPLINLRWLSHHTGSEAAEKLQCLVLICRRRSYATRGLKRRITRRSLPRYQRREEHRGEESATRRKNKKQTDVGME